jgi:hypothetical protein
VVIIDCSTDDGEAVADAIGSDGGTATFIEADIRSVDDIAAFFEEQLPSTDR